MPTRVPSPLVPGRGDRGLLQLTRHRRTASTSRELRNNGGNNVAVYIPIGIATGVAVGAMYDNIAIEVAIGVVFGAALGTFKRQDR